MTADLPRRIAVVGAGTIGASWAAHFLAHGIEVYATDAAPDGEVRLHQFIDRVWPILERAGLPNNANRDRLRYSAELDSALEGAEFVQESAVEDEAMKVDLFAQIGARVAPPVVIASSSSGLLMSNIQVECVGPERCVIGHPFNPPHLVPLVEVVGGKLTSRSAIDYAMAFYRAIGKNPIHIRKEVRGHVANRLQAALFREALHLLREEVASAADIDAAVVFGPGARWAAMGPLLTSHLAGGTGGVEHFVEHLAEPFSEWMDDLGTESITPDNARALIAGVHEETGSRSIADLASAHDDFLVALAILRREHAIVTRDI